MQLFKNSKNTNEFIMEGNAVSHIGGNTSTPAGGNGSTTTPGRNSEPVTGILVNNTTGTGDNLPVTGWLVCTSGKNKGKDYRLHSQSNKIGRSSECDVYISNDNTLSRHHAEIVYEPQESMFYLTRDNNTNTIYVNSKPLINGGVILQPYDTIKLGSETYRFIPFCSSSFKW